MMRRLKSRELRMTPVMMMLPPAPVNASSQLQQEHATTTTATTFQATQKRYSQRYTRHQTFVENRQPEWIQHKYGGVYSYENGVKHYKTWRWPQRMRTHMNLWPSDTDRSTNYLYKSYSLLHDEFHNLVGRKHDFEAPSGDFRDNDTKHELNTDMRFAGVPTSAIVNNFYENNWNKPLYPHGAHHGAVLRPAREPTEEQKQTLSRYETAEYWRRLHELIIIHRGAVGDIGPGESRNIQKVHEFFVQFQQSMTGHEFQNSHIANNLQSTRPDELEDLYAIFLEMEGNYVNEDFCPRCSLPFKTTRFCGEGEPNSPFRKWRGRDVPHQHWGKEWYNVVTRRAEALWYKSTEDALFGGKYHTQRQVENLLKVYCKSKQRGKAVHFLNQIRGSFEYLQGMVKITDEMQKQFDVLLDTTPHPHLPTNSFKVSEGVSSYTGVPNSTTVSPVQFRIDLELSRFRRWQKENGVVKVPPKGWKIDTSKIVNYNVKNKFVTNWRAVKKSIEDSYVQTGLPRESYLQSETREIIYLQDRLRDSDKLRKKLVEQFEADKKKISQCIVFPDSDYYQCFDTSAAALKDFKTDDNAALKSGSAVTITRQVFLDPKNVRHAIQNTVFSIDTTYETCHTFGFVSGTRVKIKAHKDTGMPSSASQPSKNKPGAGAGADSSSSGSGVRAMKANDTADAIIAGAALNGAVQELSAILVDSGQVVFLGHSVQNIRTQFDVSVVSTHNTVPIQLPSNEGAAAHYVPETIAGVVVGVRNNVLHAQLEGKGVAQGIARAETLRSNDVTLKSYTPPSSSTNASSTNPQQQQQQQQQQRATKLVEPFSWDTPFRNDWSEERLEELKQAPWNREEWTSMIANKYTPKEKKFGYAQNNEVDDFVTKEYSNRLLARQFFTNAQKFEIIPDHYEKSVYFGGKTEVPNRLSGFPAVDRRELDEGWGEVPDVPQHEVEAVEQALRDISGKRPGNFVKAPSEVNSLNIQEPWFERFGFGWEYRNKESLMLNLPDERSFENPTKLPFSGRLPVANTTSGIGDRLRWIIEDFSRGFDVGPHGHGAHSNTHHYDTLNNLSTQLKNFTTTDVIVQLFEKKLRDSGYDEHTWALLMTGHDATFNVKDLLLSLNEFRKFNKPPSLSLARALDSFLKDDIEQYNKGVPDSVRKLSVFNLRAAGALQSGGGGGAGASADSTLGTGMRSDNSATNLFHHTDPLTAIENNLNFTPGLNTHGGGNKAAAAGDTSGRGYLATLYVNKVLASEAQGGDEALVRHLSQVAADKLMLQLTRLVGVGIPMEVVLGRQRQSKYQGGASGGGGGRGPRADSSTPPQLILITELKRLLHDLGFTADEVSSFMAGLQFFRPRMGNHQKDDRDISYVPLQTILNYIPGSSAAAAAAHQPSEQQQQGAGAGGGSEQRRDSRGPTASPLAPSVNGTLNMRSMITWLANTRDGLVMDLRYRARQNATNPLLFEEFYLFTGPLFADEAEAKNYFVQYCCGDWVPTIDDHATPEPLSAMAVTPSVVGTRNVSPYSRANP